MNSIPYIYTGNSITALTSFSKPLSIDSSHPNFEEVLVLLTKGTDDRSLVEELMQPIVQFNKAIDTSQFQLDVDGSVFLLVDNYPFYLPFSLQEEVLRIYNAAGNLTSMVNFVTKLANNPDPDVRDQLYGFVRACGLTLTMDGDFLAYKKIRSDYKDIYSGTMDNSVGTVLEMPRHAVEKDPEKTCSRGLHFAAYGYLSHYGSSEDNRIVLVKVSPSDVVSIPTDYNNMKGRACRYQIYKEVELQEELKHSPAVYDIEDTEDEPYYEDDEYEYDNYEDEESSTLRYDITEAVSDVLVEHGWSEEEIESLVAMADAMYDHVSDGGSVVIRK